MVGLIGLGYGFFLVWLMFSRKAAGENGLLWRSRQSLGVIGSFLVLLAAAVLVLVMAMVTVDYSEFFTTVLPRTPKVVFWVFLYLLTTVTLLQGLETLGRMAVLLLPAVFLFLLIGLLANITDLDFGRLRPVLESGPGPVLQASLMHFSYQNELVAMGILGGFLGSNLRATRRALYGSQLVFALFFIAISVFLISVLGESTTVRLNFKLFKLFLNAGRPGTAVSGLDSLFVILWVALFYVKVALLQGAVGLVLAETFHFPAKYAYVGIALAAIIALYAFLPARVEWVWFYSRIFPLFWAPFPLLFLVLLNLLPARKNS